ncbi:hypothetical protein DFH11DRAFT_1548799 [Phellopilus nigrolimitatus]|nr:hypothetical protein DFH11DRAFT_1548799 [Phellopilus nigrolimitatus]
MISLSESNAHFLLLVATSAAHHISSTPPRTAQESSNHLLLSQEKRKNIAQSAPGAEALHGHRRLNRLAMIAVASTKYVVWMITAIELLARVLSLYPTHPLSATILPILLPSRSSATILPVLQPSRSLLTTPFSNVFILSTLSIFIGYVIRQACFNTMGRLFSFTHTTLSEHKLVTGGPYSVVRHPSYTGEVLVRGGMVALLLSPGGYVTECGALSLQHYSVRTGFSLAQAVIIGAVRAGLAFYIGWVVFGCTYLILRAPSEDQTLHQKFGKEWEAYSKRVPWRFIPFVA